MLFFAITMVIYLIALLVCYLASMLTSAVFWYVTGVFVGVTAAWILWQAVSRGLYSMLSRLSFCAKLKRYAEKNRYAYTACHHPLRSFFKTYAGADIRLEANGKTLCIKFFPGFIHKKLVHIQDEEHAVLSKKWALFFHKPGYVEGEGRMSEEILHRSRRIDLTFTGENGTPAVILSPACYGATCVCGSRREAVDNDYLYNHRIRFYYQKDFFKCLDRLWEK